MNFRRYIFKGILSACVASALLGGLSGPAYAEEAAQDGLVAAQKEEIVFSYKHTSARYGYSIFCPVQPKVIPASAYNPDDKGEVLLFSGTYDNIKKGWIICINGYDDKVIPENIGTMAEDEAKAFLKDFAANYGLAYAQIVEIAKSDGEGSRYGVCGPTAAEVEVDSDGDGVMDSVAVAENQMMKLFVPGQYGGRFVLGLIEEKGLVQRDVDEFMNAGLYTLQQWPTSAYDKAKNEVDKKTDK